MEIWPYIAAWGAVASMGNAGLFVFLLLQRNKDAGARLARAYQGSSLVWGLVLLLASRYTLTAPSAGNLASHFVPFLTAALAVLQLLLLCAMLEHPLLPILTGAGSTWAILLLLTSLAALLTPMSPEWALRLGQIGWLLPATATAGVLVTSLFRSRLALQYNRALYWLIAAIPLTGGQALTLLPIGPLRALGLLGHLLGAMALARGVASYWLPNVKATLRATLRLVLLFIATAALLLGMVVGAEWLTGLEPRYRTTAVAALAVIGAALYLPLYRLLNYLVDRLLAGVGFDPSQALRDYSQSISTILELEQLAAAAMQSVARVLEVRRGALLVATETQWGGLRLQPIPGLGDIPREPLAFEANSPIPAYICDTYAPLFQYEIDLHPILKQAAQRERDWLHGLEMEIYLPIRSQGKLTGLLALGPKGAGEPYSDREVAFLSTLAHQTGVALPNARLFDHLRNLNLHISQLNKDLHAAYQRLEQLDRAKSDFLTIASHELRTPLTQVRGYTDVLADLAEAGNLTPEQVLRLTESISRPTRRLEQIINAMVDAAEIDAEGLALHFAPTILASTVRLALEPWVPALEERGITLKVEGLEAIGALYGDMERLCQAFSNLISNAIKFTPDGGSIAVEARPLDAAHFEVTVSDTGIGISPAEQELIFEKFYRVGAVGLHSSGEFKFKGAGPGLGLPIAKGVVEGHGGCIWVESAGHDEATCPGSRFHVVLPYKAHRGPCHWQQPGSEPQPP